MQDTFYLSPEFLLRTQTSAGQVHVMEAKKPPIKVVSPGKVFRSDDDATHSPMFSQMEGLVVDEGITLCDLKGMLENCGIDSNKYSGFAFGLGLERIAMLKYGINNIKMLFESDLRVLDQIDD